MSQDLSRLVHIHVQQSFLPKFKNEGEDAEVAGRILAQAGAYFMQITIKHSGSLITLSADVIGAKNSICNAFTQRGRLLLYEHFKRCWGAAADHQISEMLAQMKSRRLSLSFELCTPTLGHHGQLPKGDYLVTISGNLVDENGEVCILSFLELMQFCITHRLPVNDAWLLADPASAEKARDMLDKVSVSGSPTSDILLLMNEIITKSPESIHLPGTYPHDQWQGSRIEGFVIAQGDRITSEMVADFQIVKKSLESLVLPVESVEKPRILPAQESQSEIFSMDDNEGSACLNYPPIVDLSAVNVETQRSIMESINSSCMKWKTDSFGQPIYSRAWLNAMQMGDFLSLSHQLELDGVPASCDKNEQDLVPKSLQLQVMKLVAGEAPTSSILRYKKKMSLYNEGHVGYCMMTFVIRNLLQQLREGIQDYNESVRALTRRWGLSARHTDKIMEFAACWAHWIKSNNQLEHVKEATYLDYAEPFALDFLNGLCTPWRSEGSFAGIVILANATKAFADSLAARLQVSTYISTTVKKQFKGLNDIMFSPSLVHQGCLIHIHLLCFKKLPYQFLDEGAKHMYYLHFPLSDNDDLAACTDETVMNCFYKLAGLTQDVHKHIENGLGADEVKERVMVLERDLEPLDIAERLGQGAPVVVPPGGFVFCFIAIPGLGKSSILEGIKVSGRSDLHLKVLSSDEFDGKRSNYWPVVAHDARHNFGPGESTIVMADKNLLNWPLGNFNKVARTIADADVMSIAILPVFVGKRCKFSGISDSTMDLKIPFPLEVIALCMLRVLTRSSHPAGLDSLQADALTIVLGFVLHQCGTSEENLRLEAYGSFDKLIELPVTQNTLTSDEMAVLEPVLNHLATHLHIGSDITKGAKRGNYNPESSWEPEMRRLLLQADVSCTLKKLEIPFDRILTSLQEGIISVVDAERTGRSARMDQGSNFTPLYFSISYFETEGLESVVKTHLPSANQKSMRSKLHVTLWHRESDTLERLIQLRNMQGEPVQFKVTHLDYSPDITAARVELMEHDSLYTDGRYLHITLLVGEGFAPVDSLGLPKRILDPDDEATSIPLEEELFLKGTIVAHVE